MITGFFNEDFRAKGLYLGENQEIFLGFQSNLTPALMTLGIDDATNIMNICQTGDKDYDWTNNGVAALPHPMFVFHSSNQARNEYGLLGMWTDTKFVVIGGSGDDPDGTSNARQGVDVGLQGGAAGTLGAGNRGGHLNFDPGSGGGTNGDAGDWVFNPASGTGTGRRSRMVTASGNDWLFQTDTTTLLKIVESSTNKYLGFQHNGSNAIYATDAGRHIFSQGINMQVESQISTDTTIGATTNFVTVNTTGARSETLPAISTVKNGALVIVKDPGGNAGNNNITINRGSTDTIDGGTSTSIDEDYGYKILVAHSNNDWADLTRPFYRQGRLNRTVVNASTYSITKTDCIIGVTYSSTGTTTLTLPAVATANASATTAKTYHIVDEGNNAGTYNIIINRNGVDGGTTLHTINTNGGAVTLYSEGTAWYVAQKIGGSVTTSFVTKTANYTITNNDYTIKCTTNSFDVTLPTAVGITGKTFQIKNSGSGTTITLKTTSSQTVDGEISGAITLAYLENITVQSDGANWIIL